MVPYARHDFEKKIRKSFFLQNPEKSGRRISKPSNNLKKKGLIVTMDDQPVIKIMINAYRILHNSEYIEITYYNVQMNNH